MIPRPATAALREEHRLILTMLGVLESILDAGERAASHGDLERCVLFFRLYADVCHHGKEEDLLFEALVEHGLPRHEGPIAVMLQEHELGRALVRAMGDRLDELRSGTVGAWAGLVHAGRSYIDLLRGHILKEDCGLFEMADQALEEPVCRRLCEAYEAGCAGRLEGRRSEDLAELATELARRYPGTG